MDNIQLGEITWLDVIKIGIAATAVFIPVAAVIIAAYYQDKSSRKSVMLQAKHNKKNIELQIKHKWKEDFRLHVSDYIETYLSAIYSLTYLKSDFDKSRPITERTEKSMVIMSQLNGRFSKVKLMLNTEDETAKKLINLQKEHDIELLNILNGEESKKDIGDELSKFSDVAKKIYDGLRVLGK